MPDGKSLKRLKAGAGSPGLSPGAEIERQFYLKFTITSTALCYHIHRKKSTTCIRMRGYTLPFHSPFFAVILKLRVLVPPYSPMPLRVTLAVPVLVFFW